MVVDVEPGETRIIGTLEGLAASLDDRVGHRFTRLFAGDYNTCGLTPAKRAWCWGPGESLGAGSEEDEIVSDGAKPIPMNIEPGILFNPWPSDMNSPAA